MIRGFHNAVESVQIRLGRAPSCAWVDERLPAYHDWDLPEHEFRAIERHLAHCPACKREHDGVVTLVDSVREQLAPAQFGAAAAAEFAAAVMARIDAYERTRAAAAVRNGAPWSQLRLVRVAVACAVLLVLLAGAFLVTRTPRDPGAAGATGPVAAQGDNVSVPASPHGACVAAACTALADLGLQVDLETQASRSLAILEAEALLPHTDQELEAWARREYPDVMWLYDILCKEFCYARPWREFLRESGTLLRFDWPTVKDQPNCRPSLAAVQVAASVAGYEVALADYGRFALPQLAWADVDAPSRRIGLTRRSERDSGVTLGQLPQPDGYAARIAGDPDLAKSVLGYLVVSGELLQSDESVRAAADARALLGAVLAKETCPGAGCAPVRDLDQGRLKALLTRGRVPEPGRQRGGGEMLWCPR